LTTQPREHNPQNSTSGSKRREPSADSRINKIRNAINSTTPSGRRATELAQREADRIAAIASERAATEAKRIAKRRDRCKVEIDL